MAKSQTATTGWTVADLASLYSEHRTSLVSQARRMLRDETDANEVVQEAFLKFMLAAPDLDTTERAVAYLRASVNNLALNVIRARGDRPNLVALDAETTQEQNDLVNKIIDLVEVDRVMNYFIDYERSSMRFLNEARMINAKLKLENQEMKDTIDKLQKSLDNAANNL